MGFWRDVDSLLIVESQIKLPEQREGVRQWYERTTRSWRKALVWATVIAVVGAIVFWCLGSLSLFSRIQTFNGATVIPIGAGLWMASFVFIFLIPSREASFRGQEWIESFVTLAERSIREQIAPAAKVWIRFGERMEKEVPEFLKELRQGLETVKSSAVRIEEAVKKNEQIAKDAKPIIEALKRIQQRLEKEIETGVIEDFRNATRAIQTLAGPGALRDVPESDQPNLQRALQALRARR